MKKTFLFMCILLAGLLLLQLIPEGELFGIHIKTVRLFSDITKEDEIDAQKSETLAMLGLPEEYADSLSDEQLDSMKTELIQIQQSPLVENGAMNKFYDALLSIDTLSRPVRIAYFGDSFIEGDILTEDLRFLLQNEFGGCGVGFVDVEHPIANLRGSVRSNCSHFHTHVATDKEGFNKKYSGIDLIYAVPTDTIASLSLTARGRNASKRQDRFEYSAVYYVDNEDVEFTAMADGKKVSDIKSEVCGNVKVSHFSQSMKDVSWKFHLDCSKDSNIIQELPECIVFGSSAESPKGISLDNLSLRGNSGMMLSRVPEETLKAFLTLRHYDLIILGYGLNIASKKNANYDFYEDQMKMVINRIAKNSPQSSILIVGVGDRAQKTADGITTRPEIIQLNNAQIRMAKSLGCAFWNLYEVMKKRGGIKSMTEATPPQASKDYTHINYLGGEKVAHDFFDDLMRGFNHYRNNRNETDNDNIANVD